MQAVFEKTGLSETTAETQGISVYSILLHPNEQTVKVDLSTNLHEMKLP